MRDFYAAREATKFKVGDRVVNLRTQELGTVADYEPRATMSDVVPVCYDSEADAGMTQLALVPARRLQLIEKEDDE